jgi:hypothetical protein
MTSDQIKRLRELCATYDAGALRGDEFAELVGLAREAAKTIERYTAMINDSRDILRRACKSRGGFVKDDIRAFFLRYS